jgi:hypothetical protein
MVDARSMGPLVGDPTLQPFLVQIQGCPCTPLAWGWFTPEELQRLPMPPRNLELISRIQKWETAVNRS